MTFLFVLPRSYKKWDDECKKWDDEWVTVLTTTSTAVLKTTCGLECASLPWVMWIYEVDELVAPLEKRLHIFCSNWRSPGGHSCTPPARSACPTCPACSVLSPRRVSSVPSSQSLTPSHFLVQGQGLCSPPLDCGQDPAPLEEASLVWAVATR